MKELISKKNLKKSQISDEDLEVFDLLKEKKSLFKIQLSFITNFTQIGWHDPFAF